MNKQGKANPLEELLTEIDDEIEEEKIASMSKDAQVLADVARRIVRLEKDMTMPGTATSAAARIERLGKFIEEENF